MDIETASQRFLELGHSIRLNILKLLVQAGPEGLPVSAIKKSLDCPGSTLSHHINRLCQVNIIRQVRVGRELRCHIEFDVLQGLVDFLYEECCKQSAQFDESQCCRDEPEHNT